jgi:mRNA interferase RelE/StbE
MSFEILLTPSARRMFLEIDDRRIRRVLSDRIDGLAESPEQQGKPLRAELAGYRSLRAAGRHRILYRVDGERVVVFVVAIGRRKDGSRRDVYKLAQRLVKLGLLDDADEHPKTD